MTIFFRQRKENSQKKGKDLDRQTMSSLSKAVLPDSTLSDVSSHFGDSSSSPAKQKIKSYCSPTYDNLSSPRKSKYTHFPKEEDYISKGKRFSSPPSVLSQNIASIPQGFNTINLFYSAPMRVVRPSISSAAPSEKKQISHLNSLKLPVLDKDCFSDSRELKKYIPFDMIKITHSTKKVEPVIDDSMDQSMELSMEMFKLLEKSQLLRDISNEEEAKIAVMELQYLFN